MENRQVSNELVDLVKAVSRQRVRSDNGFLAAVHHEVRTEIDRTKNLFSFSCRVYKQYESQDFQALKYINSSPVHLFWFSQKQMSRQD